MSNSKLVSYTKISPNKNSPRNKAIDRISIHCVVGQCTVERLGEIFAPSTRQASSNYGIGLDGRIGMYVEEKDRSWCTSSGANDNRAVTIEVASDTYHPYAVTSKAFSSLLDLCTDICRRNGKTKLLWFGDKAKTLAYTPKADEMVLTVHRWFANKACPGEYLYSRHGQIAAEVTARLGGSEGTGSAGAVSKPSGGTKPASGPAVGDVVTFTGTKHYVSSNSTNGKSCKPGKAKVTAVAKSGKHPYHLIWASGGGSNVYGWVDAADIQTEASAAIVKGSTVKVKKGAKTYTGGGLASFVYTNTYTVMEVSGSRVVIGQGGVVTAAVNIQDLTLVG